MDNLKRELELKLEKILHVYIFAQEAYLYTEYFHNPDTKEELDLVTNSPLSRDILKIMHLMFRTLISEVSKLFSHSEMDKFRLESFIKSIAPSGHFRKIGISVNHVEFWEEQLNKNKDIIDTILLLRSKLYAHTDNPLTDYNDIDISFKQIKSLLDLAATILKGIYRDIFDNDLLTHSPSFDRSRFGILKLLAKAEKERQDEIFGRHKNWK